MGTSTPRFALYKPLGSEDVDVNLHLNANYDKIDAAAKKSELDTLTNNMNSALAAVYTNIYGSATRTKIPACKIRKTQGQNVADNTMTVMKFEDVTWVNEGVHQELGNDQIGVDQLGIYVVTFQWTCNSAFTGRTRARITVNSSIQAENRVDMGSGGTSDNAGVVTYIGKLQNGDKVKASLLQASGSQQVAYDGNQGTYLAVCYIGKDV